VKDPIALVETAYAAAPDEATWLKAVLQAASPMLDAGHGMLGFIYDVNDPGWVTLRASSMLDFNPALGSALLGTAGNAPGGDNARWMVNTLRTTNVTTAHQTFRHIPEPMREYYAKGLQLAGFADVQFINATDPTRIGVALLAPTASDCRPTPREVHRWNRLSSHVAAGLRMHRIRSRLSGASDPAAPEAVLRPDGRLEHAETPARGARARELLERASRALDRARGPLRRSDADEALGIWEGLVAGRWSLVDHFDSDGRRYLLAHRNDPGAPDVRGLTLKERQVIAYVAAGHSNKVIAYELGLSMSTVSGHLARAKRKLGLPSLAAIRELLFQADPGDR
jgi:DNA-binding CsgD family transcriptional regulator